MLKEIIDLVDKVNRGDWVEENVDPDYDRDRGVLVKRVWVERTLESTVGDLVLSAAEVRVALALEPGHPQFEGVEGLMAALRVAFEDAAGDVLVHVRLAPSSEHTVSAFKVPPQVANIMYFDLGVPGPELSDRWEENGMA